MGLIFAKKIYRVFKNFLEDIFLLITYFLPRNRKIILFGAWWGNKFDDNSRYLFEYATKNRPDIKVYWLSSNKELVKKIKGLGYPAVYSHSLKAVYLALRARYECYCTSNGDIGDNLRKYLGGAVIINLWHGVPIKKIMYDANPSSNKISIHKRIEQVLKPRWYVACTSESYQQIFQGAFQKTKDKVLNIGQARNDYLYINTPTIYKKEYADKKIILYMPTHRQEGNKTMDMSKILDLPLINSIMEKYNAILIIKKHYYHRKELSINNAYKHIIDLTSANPEVPALLKSADVLITDYSSCYNDYLLLNRPVIFYCYDMDDYLINDREMYFDYYTNVPGPICKNNMELVTELGKVLIGLDEFQAKRQQQLDFFYSKENQGIVAPKQIETILNL